MINLRVSIFKKANSLQHKVIEQGTARDRAFFTFKDVEDPPLIILVCNGKYTYLEACTCTHHSLHGPMPEVNMKNLCSYVLACYKYIGGDKK